MMNLGGPATLDDVEPFLVRLFADREIIQLPWQDVLGKFIATRRAPRVRKLYEAIGGGSPIKAWTEAQGEAMCRRLDEMSPETAPHRFYVAFRYTTPFADDALRAMKADGITRAIAFTQYPQWSCATTGSSLNDLWRALDRTGLRDAFEWSIIDRWGEHPGFIEAMAGAVEDGLEDFPAAERDDVLVLFSAHSLPLSVIDRGDTYPAEIGGSVSRVVEAIGLRNPISCPTSPRWGRCDGRGQHGVGDHAVREERPQEPVGGADRVHQRSHRNTLRTRHQYAELAHSLGMTGFRRAPALNVRTEFLDALADIVSQHLAARTPWSSQYITRCPGCTNSECRGVPSRVVSPGESGAPACRSGTAATARLPQAADVVAHASAAAH